MTPRFVIISEKSRPEVGSRVKIFTQKLPFWKKDPLWANFQKCFPKGLMATYPRIVCEFREIWPTGSRWNRALLTRQKNTKFRLSLPLSLLRGSPHNLPEPAPDHVLGVPQISSKSVRFPRSYSRTAERVNTVETRDKVFPILGEATASSPSKNYTRWKKAMKILEDTKLH